MPICIFSVIFAYLIKYAFWHVSFRIFSGICSLVFAILHTYLNMQFGTKKLQKHAFLFLYDWRPIEMILNLWKVWACMLKRDKSKFTVFNTLVLRVEFKGVWNPKLLKLGCPNFFSKSVPYWITCRWQRLPKVFIAQQKLSAQKLCKKNWCKRVSQYSIFARKKDVNQ